MSGLPLASAQENAARFQAALDNSSAAIAQLQPAYILPTLMGVMLKTAESLERTVASALSTAAVLGADLSGPFSVEHVDLGDGNGDYFIRRQEQDLVTISITNSQHRNIMSGVTVSVSRQAMVRATGQASFAPTVLEC